MYSARPSVCLSLLPSCLLAAPSLHLFRSSVLSFFAFRIVSSAISLVPSSIQQLNFQLSVPASSFDTELVRTEAPLILTLLQDSNRSFVSPYYLESRR